MYILGALLVTFNLDWDDPQLPQLSWLTAKDSHRFNSGLTSATNQSDSAFVIAASNSRMAHSQSLANFTTLSVLITAVMTANTTLYVASRTLFSLTKSIPDTEQSPWIKRALAYFGKTNHRRVPMRATVASCCCCWVPFLYLRNSNDPGTRLVAVSSLLGIPDLSL